jgi:hypothetical protein
METLRSDAEAGASFQIHFIIHGSDAGIGFNPANEIVLWSELEPIFREMNAAMSGQLVPNMSSCEGLHGVKAASREPYPFFGLVGSKLKLSADQAKAINNTFYSMQAAGTDFNLIVEKINADNSDVLDLISAAGYDKLRKR